jgi:hypothetical protein
MRKKPSSLSLVASSSAVKAVVAISLKLGNTSAMFRRSISNGTSPSANSPNIGRLTFFPIFSSSNPARSPLYPHPYFSLANPTTSTASPRQLPSVPFPKK